MLLFPTAGLSSAADNNTIAQRRKYQSNEYIKELGLNWMDFPLGYEGVLLGKTEMIVKLQFKAAQTFTSKKGFVSSIRGLEKAGKIIGAAGVVGNVIETPPCWDFD